MDEKRCEECGIIMVPKYRVTKAYWAKRRFCSDVCKGKHIHPPGQAGVTTPLDIRLWRRVDKQGPDDCWLWTGITDMCGYGMLYRTKTPKVTWYKAHRLAYELAVGPIPEGLHVLHTCDRPACCNPNHLWVGTHADNMRDRNHKGRARSIGSPGADRKGMKNGNVRIPDEDIASIRRLYATGVWSQAALAREFGCGQTHVSRIVSGAARPQFEEA